jgi:mannose/cellobiose epimerase-like protein (N-acyl-D-glucosamine 2-epimerase family)
MSLRRIRCSLAVAHEGTNELVAYQVVARETQPARDGSVRWCYTEYLRTALCAVEEHGDGCEREFRALAECFARAGVRTSQTR